MDAGSSPAWRRAGIPFIAKPYLLAHDARMTRHFSAALLVRISFDRAEQLPEGRRSPVSVGVGGSTGSYGSGVGLGIGINLGGGPKRMADLQLSVRIDNAATGQALWEGRALTAVPVKSPANQTSLAAAKLAEALFKDFPGESGRTISVK
jgi:hypothetical protein